MREPETEQMVEYPRGKLSEDDEGALNIAIGVRDKTLIINFGKQVGWLGFGKDDALAFANAVIKRANEMA